VVMDFVNTSILLVMLLLRVTVKMQQYFVKSGWPPLGCGEPWALFGYVSVWNSLCLFIARSLL
jgi:hypothetical protein